MKSRVSAAAIVASAALLSTVLVSPAWADDRLPDLGDPTATINAVAPDMVSPIAPSAEVTATDDGSPSVTISEGVAETTLGFSESLTLDSVSDEFHVFAASAGDLAAYVKATPGGGQVYFASADTSHLTNMYVQVPIDEGAQLVPAPASIGGYLMLELDNSTVMILDKPWARAADGQELETSNELDGDRLIQHVETSATTAFPILADPAWDYALKYDIGVRTPNSVKATLHSCFNCKFPISGAPAAFPAINQLLPLTVAVIGNFECRMGLETTVDEPVWVSYDDFFNATANHIDGAGSGITFSFQFFYGDSTYSMLVSAHVVNDFGGPVGQAVYTAGAAAQWLAP